MNGDSPLQAEKASMANQGHPLPLPLHYNAMFVIDIPTVH